MGHAGGWHGGGHAYLGLGYWPSWYLPYAYYYPPYYYYYPPLAGAPSASPVYIQQDNEAQSAYWYYCADSKGYYPYVTQCPGGWLRVVPEPPKQ